MAGRETVSFRVAVTLSARQFHDGDIRAIVRRALDAAGLESRWLGLELTEGVVLLNAEDVIHTMRDLNADGIDHALDDSGTGYSCLSHLQRLPVSRIKIDRGFVTHITSNPNDAAIASAVVGMAHSLGLSVIAEDVETEGQLGFLRGIGCEEIQGYRIISITSTREDFDLLAQHHPGVVISDQRMPEMTGPEFLRRVRKLHPDAVRIVLSAYTELSSVIDAINQGAVYKFLTKPWEDEGLIEYIKDAFRIHELSRENRELSHQLQSHRARDNPIR
ncbi:MAG: EAL domain-containing protein [Sulfuritalea sp.]|nr:EAL domain-containing protein [Sulfuritalea sp.]